MSDEENNAAKDVKDEEVQDQPEAAEKEVESEKGEMTLAEVAQIAKATQKGYTQQAQQLAAIRENLEEIAGLMNQRSGAEQGDDEYVTVSRLREVLAETQTQAQARQEQANQYIESALADLSAKGIVNGKDDENSLLQFALKVKEPDLIKASVSWREIKAAKEEGKIAKKQIRQEEGSKVGTSAKAGASKEQGVSYRDIKKMDWFNPF